MAQPSVCSACGFVLTGHPSTTGLGAAQPVGQAKKWLNEGIWRHPLLTADFRTPADISGLIGTAMIFDAYARIKVE